MARAVGWKMGNYCDWKEGARTWVNLHINLYMFEPGKYLCAHPRCLAAASVSADTALPERYCCWQCHLPQPDGGHMKSLWPTLNKFVWHWYESHHNEWTDAWDSIAIYLNLTCSDLAFVLLGVDLHDCPLPFTDDARRALPESLPWRKGGHNPKIFGPPWCLKNEDPFTPHPPVGPPPSYLGERWTEQSSYSRPRDESARCGWEESGQNWSQPRQSYAAAEPLKIKEKLDRKTLRKGSTKHNKVAHQNPTRFSKAPSLGSLS